MTALVLSLALAMATPPGKVKYVAQKGDVTFDHAAHMARRAPCKSCHGDGPVQKVELGKKKAHALCIGCHAVGRAGPKACGECHID